MGYWDNKQAPENTAGDRLRFASHGDRVRGRVTDIGDADTQNGLVTLVKLADVTARQAGVDSRMETAEFFAGATVLYGKLFDLQVGVGDLLDVEYTSDKRSSKGYDVKQFEVSSQRAMQPSGLVVHAIGDVPRPEGATAPAPQTPSDLFS